jgi:hypothetical protein
VRVLTLRELNRATLERQLLLRRRRLSPLAVIERLAGMQAQWPQAPYVGVWTRVEGFRRETLERAIRSKNVLKASVMRGTLHLVTAADYPIFYGALREQRGWADPDSHAVGTRLAPEIRAFFADGPRTFQEVLDHMEHVLGVEDELTRRRAWYTARTSAHLLHVPETALWTGRPEAVYAAVELPDELDKTYARAELARRYLAAFGPAARADLAAWSGMQVTKFADALRTLEPLRRFRDERGRELIDLQRAPLPSPDTPAPVRFLPKWDNVILGFADRTRVLPDEHRKTVIAKNGDVAPTFLVDGFVAGVWRERNGKVELEPFDRLPRSAQRELREEAAHLEAFLC